MKITHEGLLKRVAEDLSNPQKIKDVTPGAAAERQKFRGTLVPLLDSTLLGKTNFSGKQLVQSCSGLATQKVGLVVGGHCLSLSYLVDGFITFQSTPIQRIRQGAK